MAITPSPFMLLEASPRDGPLHFIASTEDGHVQISGRGDRWGSAKTGEGEPRVLPGLHRTPAAARGCSRPSLRPGARPQR